MRRVLGRALGEVVPVLFGFAVGWVVLSVHGWIVGLLAFAVCTLVLSLLLRRVVRPRPLLRRVYRIALLLHVAFWCREGMRTTDLRAPGPLTVVSLGGPALTEVRVGTGDASFDLGHAPLAGYGGRPRRKALPAFGGFGAFGSLSRRWMAGRVAMFESPQEPGETLGARALVLLGANEDPLLAFVRLDLVVVDERLVVQVLERVSDLRLDEDELLVFASHTHCGPGGFHTAPLAEVTGTDFHDPRVAANVVAAAVQAIRSAAAAARPARIAFLESTDRGEDGVPILARNRRLPDPDAIDDRVLAMRFDDATDGHALALLLNYAVHPTFFGADHLAFDRDLAGEVEDALSARLPGRPPVLFVNGALGDVGPRRFERGPDALHALADRFAARVAPDLAGGTAWSHVRVRTGRALQDLGSSYVVLPIGSRRAFDEGIARRPYLSEPVSDLLALPVNALPWAVGLTEFRLGFRFDGVGGAMLRLDRYVPGGAHAFGAVVLEAADDAAGTAAERRAILWVPGEPTQALGKRWRAHAESLGLPTPFLFGLTNGTIGYVTTAEEFDRADSNEARATLFGAQTSQRVEDCLYAALSAALR